MARAFVDFIGKEGCRGWPREGQTRMRLNDFSVNFSPFDCMRGFTSYKIHLLHTRNTCAIL